ncbi:MAG: (d)CMP kinase [Lachnospiraceae bacterium]|nr:(d)CMP kinase [Lachnospiraceae bacterium]
MGMNIAMDGPAGAGKSTIAKRIAKELGIIYVDTGAMYRAMGVFFHRRGIEPQDKEGIGAAVREADVTIRYEEGQQQVYLNGENVTGYLRTEEAGRMASAISVYPAVRRKLVELQQQMAARQDVIMDGRDIGTVVLPQAELKIYLTADSGVRARRRYDELTAKGEICDLEEIQREIEARDYQDMHREESPLKQAKDAVVVDTSDMDIEQVVQAVSRLYQDRRKEKTGIQTE